MKLTEAGHSVAVLSFAGHYTKAEFQLNSDGNGGTDITLAASAAYRFGLTTTRPPEFWVARG